MSRIGARMQREKRAESKAARALIRTLLAERERDAPVEVAPWFESAEPETPARRYLTTGEAEREIWRWALLVALVCGGLVAVGTLARC